MAEMTDGAAKVEAIELLPRLTRAQRAEILRCHENRVVRDGTFEVVFELRKLEVISKESWSLTRLGEFLVDLIHRQITQDAALRDNARRLLVILDPEDRERFLDVVATRDGLKDLKIRDVKNLVALGLLIPAGKDAPIRYGRNWYRTYTLSPDLGRVAALEIAEKRSDDQRALLDD